MANKFDGDIRPLSNDARYIGVVFSGSIKNAIRQAKAAPDHGLAEQRVPAGISRNRAVLLEHLNLLDSDAHAMSAANLAPDFFSIGHGLRSGIVPKKIE
jgi:hypothetical protein